MKKRIILTLVILIFLTGCTCQYNLEIVDDTFKEEVILSSSNSSEVSEFNKQWQISIDKDVNNIGLDSSANVDYGDEIYKYKLSSNTLTFNYDFSISEYRNSTAVAKCYKTLTAMKYQDSIVISTSPKASCFEDYPPLDSVDVNITVDKSVKSHNADSVKGNVYTWHINKSNASSKGINLVIDDTIKTSVTPSSSSNNTNSNDSLNPFKNLNKEDYSLYILCCILILAVSIGYLIYDKLKKNDKNMDA